MGRVYVQLFRVNGGKKRYLLISLLVIFYGEALVMGSGAVSAGDDHLQFLRRPELGYVTQSQDDPAAVKALDGILRQSGATDIKPVRGLSRRGISIVCQQYPAAQAENIIATLRTHNQIRYTAPLFSSGDQIVAIIPEIVVRLTSEADEEQLQTLCQTMNLTVEKKLEFTEREYLIDVPAINEVDVFNALEQLNQIDFIEWAAPNVAFQPQLLGPVYPNDIYFIKQWHLNNTGQTGGTPNADVNAPEAWEVTTGDPNIVIAVIDTGVDTDHPDLINNIVQGYDFYDDDSDPNPTGNDAHGTACAGLAAARGNNGIGVTGVTWRCKIMPIRISGASGFVTDTDIAAAIRWPAANGADVLSNSWGGTSSLIIHSAITDVTRQGGIGRDGKGCVVMAAAGNWDYGGPVIYPAKYAEVIAVGATDSDDVAWYYSASGPELDVVAPSGEFDVKNAIWTTDIVGATGYNNRNTAIKDYTDKMNGTSAACPIAAGIAALILSVDPNLTSIEVQDILQTSAVDLGTAGFDNYYGYGRVDAHSAVDLTLTLLKTLPKRQWVSLYNGNGNSNDYASALAVDNSGNVYATGYSYDSSTGYDYATIKYDPNGNQVWAARYNGPGNTSDYAYALAVDNSGNVYVTGESSGSSTGYDYATIKYDPNGNQLWAARYNGPGNGYDQARALAVDDLGNVYVTGNSYGSGTGYDYATIKYDPDGNQLWAIRYNGTGNISDYAYALAADNSGNVYVTGYSWGSGGTSYDYATIKYNPSGNQLWAARYNGPGNSNDDAYALAADDSGNVYVTGESSGNNTDYDYATIKYDLNGNQKWVARYNGPGNDYDQARALAVDDTGNVYITGKSYGGSSTGYDYATIKYDSNGNQLWMTRYNGTVNNSDYAYALAVDDFGNVYVTGFSGGSTSYDAYATIKYNPNGNQKWVARYDDPGNGIDSAAALAIDKSRNIYVTGYSYGSGTAYDYATIKYTQRNYCTQELDGDLDGDCKVDCRDLALLAQQWLDPFDFTDYAALAEDWLECNFFLEEECW